MAKAAEVLQDGSLRPTSHHHLLYVPERLQSHEAEGGRAGKCVNPHEGAGGTCGARAYTRQSWQPVDVRGSFRSHLRWSSNLTETSCRAD
eukprot:scaffold50749_cov25-Tisochrysis_lutea.AAC.5